MLSKTLLLHEELELNIDLAHMLDFFCHWRTAQRRVHDVTVDQLIGKLQELDKAHLATHCHWTGI